MQSLCKYVMNSFCLVCCMWACLCWPKQYLYLLYVFQTEHFLLSSWSSDGCYGSETAKKIPRISWGGKKMVPLRFAERSCLWHHSHSPMISLTLLLCWVHAVPLVCLYVHICVRVFFHTCYGSPQNITTLSPHLVSSFSEYLGSHWQSVVCYTDMLFVCRGS